MKITYLLSALSLCTALAAKEKVAKEQDVQVIRVVYDNPEQVPEHTWDTNLYLVDKQGYSAHLEFIYWTVVEESLSYALKSNQTPWDTTGALNGPYGNYKNSNFDIDPGFRIAASFFRAPHYWEVWGQYTRMTNRGSNEISITPGSSESINATWPTFTSGATQVVSAKSSLHLNYNVVDSFFDRVFKPNPHLRIRLLAGASGIWANQNNTIKYFNSDSSTNFVQNQWKYGGAGIRFGFGGDWYWFTDLYMTSRFTIAGIIGPYKNTSYQATNTTVAGADSSLPIRNSIYRDTRSTLNLQIVIGPSYQKVINNSRIELFAGFESNFWTNLQEVYHATLSPEHGYHEPSINTGLLTLFGLTTRLTVAF